MYINELTCYRSRLSKWTYAPSPTGVEDGESYSVVLLTDDRNLRVKAHAAGLPVKDLPTFMTLFRDTKTHEQR